MKILLSLCCVTLAMLFHPAARKNESGSSFRFINIYPRESGYNYFDSMAITSAEDFKAFVEEVSRQQYWSDRQGFIDALLQAKVDFNQEALVLLRHDAGAGAARVTLETPVLHDKTLLCVIRSEILGAGVNDMPFHCFALAISKSVVDKVQLKTVMVSGGERPTILLSTTERQPFNMRRDPPPPPKPSPSECPKVILSCPTELLETGKTYMVKLVVEGNVKDDVSYNWSVTGAEIAGGQGTRALVVRIKQPNEIVKAWVSLGGVSPDCDAVANCSCGPTK